MKRFKILARIILVIIIGRVMIWHFYTQFIFINNVFDKMYYSRAYQGEYGWENRPITLKYNQVQTSNGMGFKMNIMTYLQEYLIENNEEKVIKIRISHTSPYDPMTDWPNGTPINVLETESISFRLSIQFNSGYMTPYEDTFYVRYRYDVLEKTLEKSYAIQRVEDEESKYYSGLELEDAKHILEENGLTIEYLCEQGEWMLYDKVVDDWLRSNPLSRFSKNNLGKFEVLP
ncbi:MAG: hypothetical protein ATN33_05460 [Epulopiscium sp. Nele67-Bin001]|nr:MAG: hypothetical protein ATN33_05460 [Epulopiscium sp. Nele67-Bin001]